MKSTSRPRRLLSTHGPACLAERETIGRRWCYSFDCGCFDAHLDALAMLRQELDTAIAEVIAR